MDRPGAERSPHRWAPLSNSILGGPTEDVFDKYRFKQEIGRGNFGVVRECVCLASGHRYACKTIHKAELKRPGEIAEVRREIEIMQRLTQHGHPNVVTLKGVYEDEDYIYLVMELCRGGELYDRILLNKYFTEEEAAFIFRQIVEATQFVHSQGILHRDLKPENILLAEKDGATHKKRTSRPESKSRNACNNSQRPSVKLADFGLAVFLKHGEEMSGCAGSRHYEAPELICNRSYGHKADSWSLGVILYAMLSGRLPFLESDRRSLVAAICRGRTSFREDPWPSISEDAKKLIRRMLVVDPTRRASTAEILADPWLAKHGLPRDPSPAPPTEPASPPAAPSPRPESPPASPPHPSRALGTSSMRPLSQSRTADQPSPRSPSLLSSSPSSDFISLAGSGASGQPYTPSSTPHASCASEFESTPSFTFPISTSPGRPAPSVPPSPPASPGGSPLDPALPSLEPPICVPSPPTQPPLTPHPPMAPRSRTPSPRRIVEANQGSLLGSSTSGQVAETFLSGPLANEGRTGGLRQSPFSLCCWCNRPPTNEKEPGDTVQQSSADSLSFPPLKAISSRAVNGQGLSSPAPKGASARRAGMFARSLKIVPVGQ